MRFDLDAYETVDSRLEKFWGEHPNGRVETRLLSDPAALDECVFWAGVWFDLAETHPRGVGHASEKRGGGGANQTAHLENAETSAIGRALANAGYKTKKDAPRASREEMRKAQGAPPQPQQRPPESRGDQGAQRARAAVQAQEQPAASLVQPPAAAAPPEGWGNAAPGTLGLEDERAAIRALVDECEKAGKGNASILGGALSWAGNPDLSPQKAAKIVETLRGLLPATGNAYAPENR
jgi:hypothetical protein